MGQQDPNEPTALWSWMWWQGWVAMCQPAALPPFTRPATVTVVRRQQKTSSSELSSFLFLLLRNDERMPERDVGEGLGVETMEKKKNLSQ